MKLIPIIWLIAAATALCVIYASRANASTVTVSSDTAGWQLLVDGTPYYIKGVTYLTDTVGQDPNLANYEDFMILDTNHNLVVDGPYESWVDANRNNTQDTGESVVGDFRLMKEMGVNTIRIYHHPSDDPVVMACYPPGTEGDLIWNHALNKPLLRDLFNTYGIRVAMGDEIGSYTTGSCAPWIPGTDYTDPIQIASMTASVVAMVNDSKDEPWLLMYVLGNENNYDFTHTNAYLNPGAYYHFVGEMVDLIHSMDPNHPVALANGEVQFISTAAVQAPNLDIFGANVYRNQGSFTGFGTLFSEVAAAWDKPFVVTEFGLTDPHFSGSTFNEDYQAAILLNYWCDLYGHRYGATTGNSIGGFDYQWMDSWWNNGDPNALYTGTSGNNESTGLVSQGSGANSPFERQLKNSYYMYQGVFGGQCITCN